MSGGSYNYLFLRDVEPSPTDRNLLAMAARLEGLTPGGFAASRTRLLSQKLREAQDLIKELGVVWRAVEWCDSGDSDEETALRKITEYEQMHTRAAMGSEE
ncbi:hypothetical protein N8J89_07975 [Crossiella sp. CA-258035]|uniref:hypothetical protein n=1 Tax=Crossiella sp. CA-258035 TaxID=2981138 RepID=UPI0024BD0949|nr:hypothetical protein [Crossiella sp. CA-258035]WHT20992.1 hypothetical protein N8J89_07975 [Crossiella sp. CA-258035]